MRSGTLDKLSGLPAARTALEQAQAAYDAARTAYDEAREDPMVQQLYQEAAAQEAAWEIPPAPPWNRPAATCG